MCRTKTWLNETFHCHSITKSNKIPLSRLSWALLPVSKPLAPAVLAHSWLPALVLGSACGRGLSPRPPAKTEQAPHQAPLVWVPAAKHKWIPVFFFYYYYYSFSLQPNVPLKTKQILTISLQLMGKKKIYSSGIWHKIKEKAKPDLYFQSSSFGCWRYFSKIFPITAPHCLLQTPQLRSTGACSQLGYFILKSFS